MTSSPSESKELWRAGAKVKERGGGKKEPCGIGKRKKKKGKGKGKYHVTQFEGRY